MWVFQQILENIILEKEVMIKIKKMANKVNKKSKRSKRFEISREDILAFRAAQAESLYPIIKAQERINALSAVMAHYITVPGGYVGPRELQDQMREAYRELDRVRGR